MKPRVSVIIPYYEGARWLPFSAASVLAQSGVELELIIVDDGSAAAPDTIVAALHDDRVRLVKKAHAGKGAALNAGIRAASADIICFLDQDDRMLPGRLERQAAALAASQGTDVVYSDYERVDEKGRRIDVFTSRQASNREMLHALASSTSLISIQTMVIRKKCLERLGGFSEDPALTGLDDGDLFARLTSSGAVFLYVPGVSGQWVSHSGNYSKGPEFQEARLRFIERLTELAGEYPMLRGELDNFRTHAYYMRGIYLLERGFYVTAAGEFINCLRASPFSPGALYLLLKSLLLAAAKPALRRK